MMDEAQTEGGKPEKSHAVLLGSFGIFLAIYFFCPLVLLYPVIRIYGHSPPPGKVVTAISIVFYPDILLAERVPAYQRLLVWEGSMLRG